MKRHRSSRLDRALTAAALVAVLMPAARGAEPADELILTIPEATVQRLLDRASPLSGETPAGLEYRVTSPRVTIKGGRILTRMDITVSGGVSLLGQTLGLSVDGSLDGELLVGIDARSRTIKGRFHIHKLAIKDLEELSDSDELKSFLSEHLTSFEYPVDFPTAEVPEMQMLLTGSITAIEVGEGKITIRSRLMPGRMHRRAAR